MGFNQCYVGSILQIQKELDEVGIETFVKRYTKYDSISGDSECIDFIEGIVKKYYNEKYIISNSNFNTTNEL
jgi:hypothetical protein